MNRDCWFTTWSGVSISGDPIFTQPVDDTDPNYNLVACQDQCRLEPQCQFAVVEVTDGNRQCILFDLTAQVVTDATGTVTTWEKHCTYYGKIKKKLRPST